MEISLSGSPNRRSRYLTYLCALLLAFSWQGASAASDDEAIEEIVVTGSYLKRDAANSPSPLSVLTSADIEDIGAADIAEVIQAMPWASGSQTRATTFQGEGSNGRSSINLRNLGHGATLPLLNGKRQVPSWYNGRGNASTNVNGLVPNIAIERVEVVKDGASALYGSDAVAGVVNFITKSDFEGFDFSYQFTTSDETNSGDAHSFEVLWGTQGDRGGIVVAASVLDREEIHVGDNFDRYGGTTISGTGQPGRLNPVTGEVPTWAAHGLRPGLAVDSAIDGGSLPRDFLGNGGRLGAAGFGQADVNCEDAAALEQAGPLGTLSGNNLCIYDYGPFFAIQSEEELRKIHLSGYYEFTDQVNVYFELAANESEFERLNSLNPNAPALPIPTEVDYFDSVGDAALAANPGSQEDAYRRGIEPIVYSNITRMMGGTRDTERRYRPEKTNTSIDRKDTRYVMGLEWDFDISGRQWTMDLSYTASNHASSFTNRNDTLSTHMELALSGLGGPNCDVVNGTPGEGNANYARSGGDFDSGACYFFNPFGNSQFARDGSQYDLGNLAPTTPIDPDDGVADPADYPALQLANPAEMYTWMLGKSSNDTDYKQRVIDWVFAGDLAELGGQSLGLAFGFQQRRDEGQTYVDSSLTSDNLDFVFGARPWNGKLTTNAVFGELAVPIGNNFTANFAVRYEDFDELGEDTTDPKLTLLWQPIDGLSLRGSWGTSFRVPSLQQSFGSLTTVANEEDVSGEQTFKPSITVGNPELTPESAENWGIGMSWVPTEGFFEGFAIDIDYFNYKYEDIITRQATGNLLDADNAALRAFAVANGCTTDAGPGAGSGNDCRPLWIDAIGQGVGNRAQIVRNSEAVFLRALPNFANADSAKVEGMDVNTSYTFDTGIGTWRVGLQAAWMDKYDVDVVGSDGVTVTTIEGVGNYNSRNPVARPLPEWRVNGTLNWNYNNHRAFLIVKYVDSLTSDRSAGTRGFFAATARLAGNDDVADQLDDEKIPSMTTADIQYNYSFGEMGWLRNSTVGVGIMNVTNEEAPAIAVVTAYDPTLHDGRGRMFFLRLQGSM